MLEFWKSAGRAGHDLKVNARPNEYDGVDLDTKPDQQDSTPWDKENPMYSYDCKKCGTRFDSHSRLGQVDVLCQQCACDKYHDLLKMAIDNLNVAGTCGPVSMATPAEMNAALVTLNNIRIEALKVELAKGNIVTNFLKDSISEELGPDIWNAFQRFVTIHGPAIKNAFHEFISECTKVVPDISVPRVEKNG